MRFYLFNDHTLTFFFHVIPKVFTSFPLCFRIVMMTMMMSYTVFKSVTILEIISVHFILRVIFRVGAFISSCGWEAKAKECA